MDDGRKSKVGSVSSVRNCSFFADAVSLVSRPPVPKEAAGVAGSVTITNVVCAQTFFRCSNLWLGEIDISGCKTRGRWSMEKQQEYYCVYGGNIMNVTAMPPPPPMPSNNAYLGKAPDEAAAYTRNMRLYQRCKAYINAAKYQ